MTNRDYAHKIYGLASPIIAKHFNVAELPLPNVTVMPRGNLPKVRGMYASYTRSEQNGKPLPGNILFSDEVFEMKDDMKLQILVEEFIHHYQHMNSLALAEGANRFDLGDKVAGPLAEQISADFLKRGVR